MFKSATWRSEKKIKAIFQMQFQATQVPNLKAKTLTISLVPADTGKPTVRLGKSSIHEGTCSWENPIYETVKLVKETKTGKFRGKIYYFIVSTGSSKAGFLGEASIDFVDFLGATNSVMLSLPLEPTNSGAILHVTIQNLEGILDERYIEEHESPTTKYYNGGLEMQVHDSDNLEHGNLGQNGSLGDTQFEDNSAYQAYITTTDKMPEKVSMDAGLQGNMYQRYPGWSFKSASEESAIDTTSSPKEKYARDGMQEASDDVGRLNTQIKMLERQGEVSELELQSLRRQVAKESSKVQELSGQIVALKKERDAFKTECEQLKSLPKSIEDAEILSNSHIETKNLREVPEQIKNELHREKHLSKKLKSQLQKTEDSNSELILAVRDLKEVVNRKDKEIAHLSAKIKANQNDPKVSAEACIYKMDQNAETKELEEIVKEQDKEDETELLKQEMDKLFVEIELSMKEKEELKMCIEQLTLDCEILKKENGDVYSDFEQKQTEMMEMQYKYSDSLTNAKQLKEEIKNQALLYSESLTAINELKAEVKILEKKLAEKAKDCQDNLTAVDRAKVELEQRAMRAEEALKKANWSNIKEAERLSEEFRRKSEEMTSKIDENEKLTIQAVAEANDLRLQNEVLEKLLQKANEEIQLNKDEYERNLQELSKGINLGTRSTRPVSSKMDVKVAKFNTSKRDKNNAKSINAKAKTMEVGRFKQEKRVCTQAANQNGTKIHDREQRERQCGESEMRQKWSEEKEELERERLSVKMEAEKLREQNINLRTLIDEKKRSDEILHSEMEEPSIQHDKLKHCSQEMNLENRNLKKHMIQLQGDLRKQETRPINDAVMCDKTLGAGNMHSGGVGILEGNTSVIEYHTANSKREEIPSQRDLKWDNHHAKLVSDLAKLLDEVASLKELNKHMEVELKEMQERYSEISLKFAEVEGERQQLVMTVRNLRNGKKI